MTDQELLKELIKRKIIASDLADKILKETNFSGKTVEDIIYEQKIIDEVLVAKAKSDLTGASYKKIDPGLISEEVLKLIPRETSQTYRVIPIEKKGDLLVVGMLRPDDVRATEALRFIAKQNRLSLGVYLVTPSDLNLVWRRYSVYKNEIEAAVQEVGLRTAPAEDYISLEEGARSAEEAPIIKIVATTLRQAIEMQASDVHIEPQRSRLRIRFRLDGKLEEVASLPPTLSQPIISRVKVLASLRLDETRIPQDGRFRTMILGREIDCRVATFPTPSGEKVAIRVLDPTTGLRSIKDMGLNDYNFKILDEALNLPYGMVLVTGPTGSGKTTMLYAIIRRLSSSQTNIVTLEDPVEYFMEGVNQSQVKPEISYDFASGLRQILRQDPDVIMVGEIRDTETAGLAVNAALTGHTMLSTLHTNNSIGVIPRLVDLGVPPFLLSSALRLMTAQRLVSLLCSDCKKSEEAPPKAQKIIDEALNNLPPDFRKEIKFKSPYNIYHSEPNPNCKICKGKGVVGRIAIFEIFRMTRELGDLINTTFTEGKLWDEAKRQGMVTLRQDGIIKALEGKVLFEEVLRETEK